MSRTLNVCITGACGNIAYSLYNSLCSGFVLGAQNKLDLRLLEIPDKKAQLAILSRQLEDCCYANVSQLRFFDSAQQAQAFQDADLVIYLGGKSRKPGMDRNEVYEANAEIFQVHGRNLNKYAKKSCLSLVVANPTNTNCIVLASNAPSIPIQNFTCLSRLDYNRFLSYAARLFDCNPKEIRNTIIWGNHSRKQLCDLSHAEVSGRSKDDINERIKNLDPKQIGSLLYERGGFILQKQGATYLSATKAIIDHLYDWFHGSENIVSMGVVVPQELYGVPKGICFSMPTRCIGSGSFHIVEDLSLGEMQLEKLAENREELIKQLSIVNEYMPLEQVNQ